MMTSEPSCLHLPTCYTRVAATGWPYYHYDLLRATVMFPHWPRHLTSAPHDLACQRLEPCTFPDRCRYHDRRACGMVICHVIGLGYMSLRKDATVASTHIEQARSRGALSTPPQGFSDENFIAFNRSLQVGHTQMLMFRVSNQNSSRPVEISLVIAFQARDVRPVAYDDCLESWGQLARTQRATNYRNLPSTSWSI